MNKGGHLRRAWQERFRCFAPWCFGDVPVAWPGSDARGGCTPSCPVPSPEARALCPAPRPALCSPASLPALPASGPSACPVVDHQTDLETQSATGSSGTFLGAGAAGSCIHVGPKPAPCREPIPGAPLKPLELGEPQHLPLLGTVGSWGVEGKTTPRERPGPAVCAATEHGLAGDKGQSAASGTESGTASGTELGVKSS